MSTNTTARPWLDASLSVEQRVDAALSVGDRIAFVGSGRVAATVPVKGLARNAPEFAAHFGV